MSKRRRRLTGEEARARILEAAVERLRAEGPEGLRLNALAKELGISHQAILYHFGSREGLVAAVVKSAIDNLQAELLGGLRVLEDKDRGAEALIDRTFEVMVDEGYGRLLAWVALTQGDPPVEEHRHPIEMLARMAHEVRERDHDDVDYQDTLFTITLLAFAVLGASVAGAGVTRAAGLEDDAETRRAFRTWLRTLVVEHLESAGATKEP